LFQKLIKGLKHTIIFGELIPDIQKKVDAQHVWESMSFTKYEEIDPVYGMR
jgi:hypothetical protein